MEIWQENWCITTSRTNKNPLHSISPSVSTKVIFDTVSDLIWVGDTKGFISSFDANNVSRYVSFKGHDSQVSQLLQHLQGIVSIGSDSLRFTNRRGIPKLVMRDPQFTFLTSMAYSNIDQTSVVLSGSMKKLITVDLEKSKITSNIPYTHDTSLMCSNGRTACIGRDDGLIDLLDTRTMSITKTLQAHSGILSGIDCNDTTLLTCGASLRNDVLVPDTLVNVYDLRFLRSLTPISFPSGASFVKLHPMFSSKCLIASSSGLIHSVDMFNPEETSVFQVEVPTFINSLNYCNTGDYIAVLDGYSNLHVLSNERKDPPSSSVVIDYDGAKNNGSLKSPMTTSNRNGNHNHNHTKQFSFSSQPLEYPTIQDSNSKEAIFSINDDVALNSVGLPYYREPLLSAWNHNMVFNSVDSMPSKPIDNDIIKNVKMVDFIGFAPYDKKKYGKRNLTTHYKSLDKNKNKDDNNIPKFISEQQKRRLYNGSYNDTNNNISDKNDINSNITTNNNNNNVNNKNNNHHSLNNNSNSNSNLASNIFDVIKTDDYFNEDIQLDSNIVPNMYNKLEILYSKFGVDDFDFDFYNKTKYSGLETHIINYYSNPLLQLLRFCPFIFNFVIDYLKDEHLEYNNDDNNKIENKLFNDGTTIGGENLNLIVQLGYLFDMLYKGNGVHCIPSNFQLAFCKVPEAQVLGLIQEEGPKDPLGLRVLIHSFNRFLLEKLANDEKKGNKSNNNGNGNGNGNENKNKNNNKNKNKNEEDKTNINENEHDLENNKGILDDILGIDLNTDVRGVNCGSIRSKRSMVYTINISSPPSSTINSNSSSQQQIFDSFTFLEDSMKKKFQTRGWCNKCKKYQTMETIKSINKLPNVLSMNVDITDDEISKIHTSKNWLVPEFYVNDPKLNSSNITITRTENDVTVEKYELVGYVAEIVSTNEDDNHLISFINIPPAGDDTSNMKKTWHLFNDFLVNPISESEALNLQYTWKIPVILMYQKVENFKSKSTIDNNQLQLFDYVSWRKNLDESILYRDHFAVGTRRDKIIEYELLTRQEAPKPGSLIAIDAEFVSLESEKIEIRSDGTRSTIRPKRLSLARVSVLRGNKDDSLFGKPFIDDYISTSAHIQDYLTAYSGIEPGDLDPRVSRRSLVTLETAYRRLWLLLNLGCVFVGHGLASDFRIINIHIPPQQVRDTSLIYYLKSWQRKLSLRFLAYIALDLKVQMHNHDSIEDAKTTLLLYHKYLELQSKGIFFPELLKIYHEGQTMRFKAPEPLNLENKK